MKKALAWFTSPLARRLNDLEDATETPAGEKALATFARNLNANPPDKERVGLIIRVARSYETGAMAIEMALATTGALMRLANRVQPPAMQTKEEDVQLRLKKTRGEITDMMAQQIVITYLYAFRDVSAGDLEQAIRFYESEDGKWVKLGIFTGLLTSIHKVWASVGDKLVNYSQ